MSFFKHAVSALAVAGSAAAVCSTSATLTVQNGGDATALASCATFTGSIALATGVAGAIAFDGIKQITGDFNAVNATGVTTLSGNSLTNIGGALTLTSLTVLTGFNFPLLTSVGNIYWTTLPQLQGLGLTNTIQKVSTLNIQDTHLATLSGINLTTADTVYISNNVYLSTIDMQLANVTNILTLQGNNQGQCAATFPSLVSAGGLSISQVSSLGIDSLTTISNTMNIISNPNLQSLSAPNLTTTGGLAIQSNAALANISFPALQKCATGALNMNANTALTGSIDFPALTTVTGAVNVTGAYTAVTAPALKDVEGVTYLVSSKDISATCTQFSKYYSTGILKKSPTCTSATTASGSGTASGTSTATSTGASSTSTKSSAMISNASAGMVGFAGLFAAAFALL